MPAATARPPRPAALDRRLKELDVALKEQQLASNSKGLSPLRNPLILGVIGGIVALLGNGLVAWLNGTLNRGLEDRKAAYSRVLEMLKVGDPDLAAENLQMLLDSGLYTDEDGKLTKYLANRTPGSGGFLPAPQGPTRSGKPQPRPVAPEVMAAIKGANGSAKKWLDIAAGEIGTSETFGPETDARVGKYLASAGLTSDGDDLPWSAAFVNWVIEQAGLPGTKSGMARQWLSWGLEVQTPVIGAVVVFSRTSNPMLGTVGFFIGADTKGNVIYLGGNIQNQVTVGSLPPTRVLGYRWPKDIAFDPAPASPPVLPSIAQVDEATPPASE
jgi:uncharacterized protein (TIGR02594 family)